MKNAVIIVLGLEEDHKHPASYRILVRSMVSPMLKSANRKSTSCAWSSCSVPVPWQFAVAERYIHGPVGTERVGKVRYAVVADENVYRTGFGGSVHSRITTNENRTAGGPQCASIDIGMIEVNRRAAPNRRDCTVIEKAAVSVTGDVLENNRATIFGVDRAADFVRDWNVVECDDALVLSFNCTVIVDVTPATVAAVAELICP